jgi:hypothetical protein
MRKFIACLGVLTLILFSADPVFPCAEGQVKKIAGGVWACGTDSGSGGLTCVIYTPWSPCDDLDPSACAASDTDGCLAVTDIGAVAHAGQTFGVDTDQFTYAKIMFSADWSSSAGVISVILHNISDNDAEITDTFNSDTSCIDRSNGSATQLDPNNTGVDLFGLKIGSATATDDPQFSAVSVMFCDGAF